jgi:hypothetical protein
MTRHGIHALVVLAITTMAVAAGAAEPDPEGALPEPASVPGMVVAVPPAPLQRMRDRIGWVRAGALLGGQIEHNRIAQAGFKLQFFEVDWQSAYAVPLMTAWTFGLGDPGPYNRQIDFMVGGEAGFLHRWADDRLMLGVAFGLAGGGPWTMAGLALRPTIRYRHYWGRLGVEVSLEVPLIMGKVVHFTEREFTPGEPAGWHVSGWLPVLGFSIGM